MFVGQPRNLSYDIKIFQRENRDLALTKSVLDRCGIKVNEELEDGEYVCKKKYSHDDYPVTIAEDLKKMVTEISDLTLS